MAGFQTFGRGRIWAFANKVKLAGVLVGTPIVRDYAGRTVFDSASWKAENRQGAAGVRVRMVDDLLPTRKLVGMSRAQLEDLLGVPPATAYFREYDYVDWLGPERGLFSVDSEWLVVKCGQGFVVSARASPTDTRRLTPKWSDAAAVWGRSCHRGARLIRNVAASK